MEFDDKISAYIESNQSYAIELFNIARQHRLTYMTLNESAFRLFQPILEWFEKRKLYDECLKYVYKNIPDCIDRTLYIKTVLDKIDLIKKRKQQTIKNILDKDFSM